MKIDKAKLVVYLSMLIFCLVFWALFFLCAKKVCAQSILNREAYSVLEFFTDSKKWWIPKADNAFAIGSFSGFVADAIKDSGGNAKYLGSSGNWHAYRDIANICFVLTGVQIARKVFVDRISYKQVGKLMLKMGLKRFLVKAKDKINKGGLSAYNDPAYNQHAIVYPSISFNPLSFKDNYLATGKWTTPIVDLLVIGTLILLK